MINVFLTLLIPLILSVICTHSRNYCANYKIWKMRNLCSSYYWLQWPIFVDDCTFLIKKTILLFFKEYIHRKILILVKYTNKTWCTKYCPYFFEKNERKKILIVNKCTYFNQIRNWNHKYIISVITINFYHNH